MKLSRREEKAMATIRRMNDAKKRGAAALARQADRLTGVGLTVAAGMGVSFYMARYSADKPEWMGFPKEVWIGLGLLGLGIYLGSRKGKGSQMAAHVTLSMAQGVLTAVGAAWADSKGEEMRLAAG